MCFFFKLNTDEHENRKLLFDRKQTVLTFATGELLAQDENFDPRTVGYKKWSFLLAKATVSKKRTLKKSHSSKFTYRIGKLHMKLQCLPTFVHQKNRKTNSLLYRTTVDEYSELIKQKF